MLGTVLVSPVGRHWPQNNQLGLFGNTEKAWPSHECNSSEKVRALAQPKSKRMEHCSSPKKNEPSRTWWEAHSMPRPRCQVLLLLLRTSVFCVFSAHISTLKLVNVPFFPALTNSSKAKVLHSQRNCPWGGGVSTLVE